MIVLVIMAILNKQEERRARERRASLETMAVAALGLAKTQPLLTAAIATALVFGNLLGTKKRDD